MPHVCSLILHILLPTAWTVAGYCAVLFSAHPCAEHAIVAGVQPANAAVLLWFVWPRKVVARGC